jgi:hypothetical protein
LPARLLIAQSGADYPFRGSVNLIGPVGAFVPFIIIVARTTIILAEGPAIPIVILSGSLLVSSRASVASTGDIGAALRNTRSGITEHPVGAGNATFPYVNFDAATGNAVDHTGRIRNAAEPVLPCARHQSLRLCPRRYREHGATDEQSRSQNCTKHGPFSIQGVPMYASHDERSNNGKCSQPRWPLIARHSGMTPGDRRHWRLRPAAV